MKDPTSEIWQAYERAEAFLPWNAKEKVFQAWVSPHWILDAAGSCTHFWYLRKSRAGETFMLVNTETGTCRLAFDHTRLAAAFSTASGKAVQANHLPFSQFDWLTGNRQVAFNAVGSRWICDLETYACTKIESLATGKPLERRSPDGRWALFNRDHNLHLRNIQTGEEKNLTVDGDPFYDYSTSPECNMATVTRRRMGTRFPPVALWSPNSRFVITHRLDQRRVKEMHLLQSVPEDGSVRPVLHSYRYPLFGDEHVPQVELLVFDIETGRSTALDHPPMDATVFTPIEFRWLWWSPGGERFYFIDRDRQQRVLELYECDAATGNVHKIIEERGETKIAPNMWLAGVPIVYELDGGREITWFSERDGWGHLYLYDRASGKLKKQITHGQWAVRDVLHVDPENRWIYFVAGGREPGREPFFRHFYRVQVDSGEVQLLTPENADHEVTLSPDAKCFTDTYGTINTPSTSVLRRIDGALVGELEQTDYSALEEMGWRRPEPFRVIAADGETDLYGALFFPTTFDPDKRYPVINSIYGGAQMLRVPKSYPHPDDIFGMFDFWEPQALAELGFIVFTLDARGRPFRSKAFQDVSGKRVQDMGGLPDHVTGMRQLAEQRPYMDLSRVGIYGLSAGGYNAARAMLEYADVFHVGVAAGGSHEYRVYAPLFGERGGGLEDHEHLGENSKLAGNLQGKLMLVHGELDDNVHPAHTLRLADALIRADKDFDLLIMTNHNHVCNQNPYFIRRLWNYFVEHLQGLRPPKGYHIQSSPDELSGVDAYVTPPSEHDE